MMIDDFMIFMRLKSFLNKVSFRLAVFYSLYKVKYKEQCTINQENNVIFKKRSVKWDVAFVTKKKPDVPF